MSSPGDAVQNLICKTDFENWEIMFAWSNAVNVTV